MFGEKTKVRIQKLENKIYNQNIVLREILKYQNVLIDLQNIDQILGQPVMNVTYDPALVSKITSVSLKYYTINIRPMYSDEVLAIDTHSLTEEVSGKRTYTHIKSDMNKKVKEILRQRQLDINKAYLNIQSKIQTLQSDWIS